jgi:hypothetical protein
MVLAPLSLDSNLRQAARTFLNTMRRSEFDVVWGDLLPREAEKPHTAVEIADMELAIKVNNTIYHLCMPFKSGRESQSSFDVNVFHQMMRPFLVLSNCVVVFVAAKPCTQGLHNYVKHMRNKFGCSVEIIEYKALAKLLKINGLL